MFEMRRIAPVIALVCVGFAGCMTSPRIADFTKQAFTLQTTPPLHVALRGVRNDRRLVCQVFLLDDRDTARLSNVELRLASGALIDPRRIRSLEKPSGTSTPQISFGFTSETETGPSQALGEQPGTGCQEWEAGSSAPTVATNQRTDAGTASASYRTDTGAAVPVWRLLGRRKAVSSPRSLQLTYVLPKTQTTLNGCELIVGLVAVEDRPDASAQAGSTTRDTVAVEIAKRQTVIFAMAEKTPSGQEDDARQKTRSLVKEINFTMKTRS